MKLKFGVGAALLYSLIAAILIISVAAMFISILHWFGVELCLAIAVVAIFTLPAAMIAAEYYFEGGTNHDHD